MSKLLATRQRFEQALEKFGHAIYRNRLKALVSLFIFIGALAAQIPKLEIDTSQESLLHKTDPIRVEYNNFRDQFGLDDMIVIAITPPEVFDSEFMKKLQAFHEDIEDEVPYLKNVTSLLNARHTYGEGDTLIVEDLLEGWPEKEIDMSWLRSTVLNNPVYLNNYISEDGRTTAVVIETEASVGAESAEEILAGFEEDVSASDASRIEERHFLTGKEITEVVEALHRIINLYQSPDFSVALAGTTVQFDILKRTMLKDMQRNIRFLILIVAITLFLFFRRITGVILPLLVVMLSAVSTLGLMALFKIPFTTPSQIIPPFLIAVGIGDSIHILAIFYKRLQEGSPKEDAIAYALGHSGLAVIMTSLTTAVGLLSFSFAEMAPIAHMGLFCAGGVMLALVYTIIMLPAFLALIPLAPKQTSQKEKKRTLMDRVLLSFARLAAAHPMKIVVVSLILMLISLPLMFRIGFSHDSVAWMPDTMKTKRDVLFIDKELKGATTLEVVIDTGQENGLYEPEMLQKVEQLSDHIEKIRSAHLSVGKVFSVNDLLKETNQALHANDTNFYSIPDQRDTIAQELFLFENSGSDDLEKLVDSQFRKARFTIKTSWTNAVFYADFIGNIKNMFHETFSDKVKLTITGLVSIMARAVPASIHSAIKSYIIAFVVIAFMMIFLVGGMRIGLYSLLPNLLPIFLILGIMGVAKIPMDIMSVLIGSIAIGLVVDDTVHFIYNFRKYYHKTGDARQAIETTLLGVGRAMLVTSIVLSAGFFVSLFSTMLNVKRFGGLITTTIIMALIADVVLGPALMILVTRKKIQTTFPETVREIQG